MHCLKYQAVVTPDGLIAHLYGPLEGRYHDVTAWHKSGLAEHLAQHAYNPDGIALQIFGDPAYGVTEHLLSPYSGINTTAEQLVWNKAMSKVRIVVEWCFKEVITQFRQLFFQLPLRS
jgi:hypothetical protein